MILPADEPRLSRPVSARVGQQRTVIPPQLTWYTRRKRACFVLTSTQAQIVESRSNSERRILGADTQTPRPAQRFAEGLVQLACMTPGERTQKSPHPWKEPSPQTRQHPARRIPARTSRTPHDQYGNHPPASTPPTSMSYDPDSRHPPGRPAAPMVINQRPPTRDDPSTSPLPTTPRSATSDSCIENHPQAANTPLTGSASTDSGPISLLLTDTRPRSEATVRVNPTQPTKPHIGGFRLRACADHQPA